MMKKLAFGLVAISLFLSFGASAGSIDGKVTSISYMRTCSSAWDGCVFVDFDTEIENFAGCQWLAHPSRMALDYNGPRSDQDVQMINALTLALENNLRVQVTGFGICDIHANTESIETVTIYGNQ